MLEKGTDHTHLQSRLAMVAGTIVACVGVLSIMALVVVTYTLPSLQALKAEVIGSTTTDDLGDLPEIVDEEEIDAVDEAASVLPTIAKPTVIYDVKSLIKETTPVIIRNSTGSKVVALVRNTETGLEKPLKLLLSGATTKTWKFEIDPRSVPAGQYVVVSRTTYEGQIFEDTSFVITLEQPALLESASLDQEVTSTSSASSVTVPTVDFSSVTADGLYRKFYLTTNITPVPTVLLRDRENKVVREIKSIESPAAGKYYFKFSTEGLPPNTYNLAARYTVDEKVQLKTGPVFIIASTSVTTLKATSTATTTIEGTIVVIKEIKTELPRYKAYEVSGVNLQFVEFYLRDKVKVEPQFSGLAKRVSDNNWRYSLDTASLPQGEYQISIRYKADGVLKSLVGPVFKAEAITTDKLMATSSTPVKTAEAPKQITITEAINKQLPIVEETKKEVEEFVADKTLQSASSSNPATIKPQTLNENTLIILKEREVDLKGYLDRYGVALRSQDKSAIEKAKADLLNFVRNTAADSDDEKAMLVMAELEAHATRLMKRTEQIESLIAERTAGTISLDSDKDGVTDFDEKTIYNTDPLIADSDSDGFTDGSEILSGFNPVDPSKEASFVYESPKDAGLVRSDVLVVNEILPITESSPVEDGVVAQAEVSGKALPNSFVTLYIFSTPVVVTLKTEDDGSWVYKLDKDLEDGEHEMYVGITDNTGSIVAKSEPFRFVKEAQAFTPADAIKEVAPEATIATSTFELPIVQLLILACMVMLAGLILMYLGYQLDLLKRRNQK